nr:MAG TPA: YonK protein [Caudoviricetes sp.]
MIKKLKRTKSISLKNATINLEDETVTEYTKDETRTYNIRKILKDWDQVDGVSITIKQDDEVPADE